MSHSMPKETKKYLHLTDFAQIFRTPSIGISKVPCEVKKKLKNPKYPFEGFFDPWWNSLVQRFAYAKKYSHFNTSPNKQFLR